MKLKRYDKEFEHSYTLGLSPTIELLKAKPELAFRIISHSKLTSVEGLKQLAAYGDQCGIRVEQNDRLIEKLRSKSDCLVIGAFRKYRSTLDARSNHVVLVNPSNAGNIGTVIRCMLAFAFHDLAIIEPATDVFSPTAIRSSMGALFGIRFEHFGDIAEYRARHETHHLYPFMTTAQTVLEHATFVEPCSLIFGNESSGLPDDYERLGEPIRIAQSTDVDSLNLALTTGIVLHHLYRSSHAEVEDSGHLSQT